MQSLICLYDLDHPALQALLEGWDEPSYRADQLWEWLYVHLVDSFDQMTNLPQALRERLAAEAVIGVPGVVDMLRSPDGRTRKDLLRLRDCPKQVLRAMGRWCPLSSGTRGNVKPDVPLRSIGYNVTITAWALQPVTIA